MRYLIFSDLHANLDAFEAVLGAAPSADRILILGDIVGYGAEPNAVIDRVRTLDPVQIIRGNHDKVASGLEMPDSFNPAALQSAAWTFDKLTVDNRAWLYAIPPGPAEIDETIEICHGSPEDEDEYLFSAADAGRVFPSVTRPVCFFGHTHVAVTYSTCANFKEVELREPDQDGTSTVIGIKPRRHYLINPWRGRPAARRRPARRLRLLRHVHPERRAAARPVRRGPRPAAHPRRRPARRPGAAPRPQAIALQR